MIKQGQISLRVAAISQLPADGDNHRAVCLCDRVIAHIAGALLGVDGFDLVIDLDAGNRWFNRDQDFAAIVAGHEAQGLEVDHQRVGLDQEGLVLVIAVIVEHRQLRLIEEVAVKHQVAGHLLHAIGAQVAHQ